MTMKTACMAVLLLFFVHTAQAARSTTRLSVRPQPVSTDTSSPVITIISPDLKTALTAEYNEIKTTVSGRAVDDSGVVSVSVNNEPARLNDRGDFSAEVLLKPGVNRIEVAALNVRGNKRVESFTLRRQIDPVNVPGNSHGKLAVSGKSYALVVGINSYQNIDRLSTAVNDAVEIANTLEKHYDFKTTRLLDTRATRSAILKELNILKNIITSEDRLLIFYAGHGWHDRETETSYWLPVDAERNDTTNWLEAKTVTDELRRSVAKQVVIIADSCYAGTISRSFDPRLSGGGGTREAYLKKLMEKPTRVLIASGGDEPVSDSGESGHSIFSGVLIKALLNPFSNEFTAEELLTMHLKESVAGRSRQTPEYKIIRSSGHEGGDFVFIKTR